MKFKHLAKAAATLCLALTLAWLCTPQILLASWGLALSPLAALLGRRMAALFAGTGIMFYLARNEAPSAARNAITVGFGTACLVLACLGCMECVLGHAGLGILSAVLGEIAFGLACLYVVRTHTATVPA